MAVGVTSGTRGIYFSHPVYLSQGDKPVGVAVIKTSVSELEKEISGVSGGIALLVNRSGMIFASSNEKWNLNFLWNVIILDLIMPEMDGSKCLQELLQSDPLVKVIVARGYSANRSVHKPSKVVSTVYGADAI